MIACFFGKTGDVAIEQLEQRRTVNAEWYTTISLPIIFQEIRKINRQRRITLPHDNASSHTSAQTTAFLSTQNIDLMSHPPYSPDLAPNDFFLFPYVSVNTPIRSLESVLSHCTANILVNITHIREVILWKFLKNTEFYRKYGGKLTTSLLDGLGVCR